MTMLSRRTRSCLPRHNWSSCFFGNKLHKSPSCLLSSSQPTIPSLRFVKLKMLNRLNKFKPIWWSRQRCTPYHLFWIKHGRVGSDRPRVQGRWDASHILGSTSVTSIEHQFMKFFVKIIFLRDFLAWFPKRWTENVCSLTGNHPMCAY